MPPAASGAAKPFPKDAIARVRERFGDWDAWFGHIGTGPGEGADRISRGFGFYVGPESHILTTHAVVKGLALFRVRKKPPHVATFG